jgi:hypothetical protein
MKKEFSGLKWGYVNLITVPPFLATTRKISEIVIHEIGSITASWEIRKVSGGWALET